MLTLAIPYISNPQNLKAINTSCSLLGYNLYLLVFNIITTSYPSFFIYFSNVLSLTLPMLEMK